MAQKLGVLPTVLEDQSSLPSPILEEWQKPMATAQGT